MIGNIDTCPNCGKKIIKGAMRCIGCGKILKSAEEQLASIKKLKETQKKSYIGSIIKFIFLILAIGVVYYFFSEEIVEFINNFLNK